MARRKIIFFVLFLFYPTILIGQSGYNNAQKIKYTSALKEGMPAGKRFLGLDLNKVQMSHSYSMAFASAGGSSFTQGMYLNNISYKLNSPITLQLEWGVLQQPLQSSAGNNLFSNGFFVSKAGMEYAPNENFKIGIQYSTYPQSRYDRRYSRYRNYLPEK